MSRVVEAQKKLNTALDQLESSLSRIPTAPSHPDPTAMPDELKNHILDEIARIDAQLENAITCLQTDTSADAGPQEPGE